MTEAKSDCALRREAKRMFLRIGTHVKVKVHCMKGYPVTPVSDLMIVRVQNTEVPRYDAVLLRVHIHTASILHRAAKHMLMT